MVCPYCQGPHDGEVVCPTCKRPVGEHEETIAQGRWTRLKWVIGILIVAFLSTVGVLLYQGYVSTQQLHAITRLAESNNVQLQSTASDGNPKTIAAGESTATPNLRHHQIVEEIAKETFPDGLTMNGLAKDVWLKGTPGERINFPYNAHIGNAGTRPITVDMIFKMRCEETGGAILFNPCYEKGQRILGVRNGAMDYFMRFPPQGLHLHEDNLLPSTELDTINIIGMHGFRDVSNPRAGTVNYELLLHGVPNNAYAFIIPETAHHGSSFAIRYSFVRNGKEFVFPHITRIVVE